MSSYFDDASREVFQILTDLKPHDDQDKLDAIQTIERRVISEVAAVVGDVEFPDDLRVVVCRQITDNAILPRHLRLQGLYTKGQQMSLILSQSTLVERLHDAFHTVAERKIETRFGSLRDHPARTLRDMADHYKEKHGS